MKYMLTLLLCIGCQAQLFSRINTSSYVAQPRWDDSMVPALAFKTGASAPTIGTFGPSGGLQIYLFQPASVDDQVYFTVQLPHSWQEGQTNLKPHVHWTRTAAPSSAGLTNVVCGLEYSIQTINGAFSAPSTIRCTNYVASSNWTHQISSFPSIDGTGMKLSTVLVGRMFREGTSDSDTYDKDVACLGFDIHFLQDSLGSTYETVK
jgi:hypothetical protein